jgi:hypothetical protein
VPIASPIPHRQAMLPNEQHQGQGQQAAGGGGGGGGGVGRQGPSSGSVVMVSAALAGHGIPNYDAFTAAKAAVEGGRGDVRLGEGRDGRGDAAPLLAPWRQPGPDCA